MTTIHAPTRTASWATTASTVAARTTRKLLRTPQVFGIAVVQSVVFLLMFRYVIGGAIGVQRRHLRRVPRARASSSRAFSSPAAEGRSPSPRKPRRACTTGCGRCRSPTARCSRVARWPTPRSWCSSGSVTLGVGFVIGFRMNTTVADFVFTLVLLVVYALCFAFVFVWLGLVSGNAQAAQGLSILAVPFSFISSTFVPIATMPGAVQAFAKAQPLTFMVNSWRGCSSVTTSRARSTTTSRTT